jgi:periplasmic protein TonB
MTNGRTHHLDIVPTRERGDSDFSTVVPFAAARAEPTASAIASAPPIAVDNVIPFARAREPSSKPAPEVAFDLAQRPAPLVLGLERRAQTGALLLVSLLMHGSLYVAFTREPEPMASIGIEAISVEIVLGANMPAGLAATPGRQQATSAPAHDPNPNQLDPDTTAKVEEVRPKDVIPDQQQQAKPADTAVAEVKPEQTVAEVAERPIPAQPAEAQPERAEEPPQQTALLRTEPTPASREPELTAAPEEPTKVTPAEPDKPHPVKTETKPEPTPKHDTRKKEREARPKQERPGPAQKTASRDTNPTGPRAVAASGVGPGRSQLDTNYRGLVAAHLARHKQFPAEARSRGEQGSATVSFALDGSGRVTRVALVRGSGVASIDQEATAMVRRASPFPAPPGGRGMSFTVPVSFRIQ